MLIMFTLRHLVRHWRMHLAVLVGMTLCGALLAALPLYAAAIAGDSLSQSLNGAFAFVRNLEIRGDHLSGAEREQLYSTFGAHVEADYELREALVDSERVVYDAEEGLRRVDEVLFLRLWSIPLGGHVTILEGRLPSAEPVGTVNGKMVLEAAVGARAREQIDVALGDEVVLEKAPYRVRVVGVVSPSDAGSDLWWSDPLLLPFNAEREPTNQVDKLYLSLILSPETLDERIPRAERYWRVLLHWQAIGVDNAQSVRDDLVELRAHLSASGAEVRTGLIALLDRYRLQMRLGRISLLLLTAQSLLAGLYVLGTVSALLVDQSRTELASMIGRGFGEWQITRLLALEMALLGLVALPVGPLLAHGVFRAWSALTGHPVVHRLPTEAWLLSGIAVAGAWLSLVVSAHFACKQGLPEQLRERGRPSRAAAFGFLSAWQRLTIDAFLLILGGLAYWQLRQTGTFVREVDGLGGVAVDPVLLLGPSLFLLALGLVFLRIFPLLLRALGRLSQSASNLVVPLAIMRMARHVGRASQMALLITLTTALVFFATVFRDSIVQRQQEIAHYVAGADVRVEMPPDEKKAVAQAATVEALTGVTAAAHTFRHQARWSPFRSTSVNARPVAFLAVERDRFAQVARYPPGTGLAQMGVLMAALAERGSGAVPLLVSSDAPPGDSQIGSAVQYYLGTQLCDFEIRGIVDQFPTLRAPFIVADLSALAARVDLDDLSLASAGGRELWLEVDPDQHDALLGTLQREVVDESDLGRFASGRIAADVDAHLRAFRADLIARVTAAAFGLNAVVLVVLSAASFLLVQVFAARRRLVEFGVLRAMGLTGRQLLGLLSLEASVVLVLGLGAGTAVGYGLAQVMRPFVSLTLASSLGERAIDRVVIDWAALGPAYAVLLGVYVSALLLLLGALERSDVHRTLRLGDE